MPKTIKNLPRLTLFGHGQWGGNIARSFSTFGALQVDKHVFIEKPMALDLADAEGLVGTAAERWKNLMPGPGGYPGSLANKSSQKSTMAPKRRNDMACRAGVRPRTEPQ